MNVLSQVTRPSLDRASFRAWLVARSSEVVGQSASEYICPLARFLNDSDPDDQALYGVGDDVYWVWGALGNTPLPSWASAFVRCLDFTHPLLDVTGTQALHLLDEVCVSSASPVSKVYTLGYAAKGAEEHLSALMAEPTVTLVDIRLRAVSRFRPAFRGSALSCRFGAQYLHVPELGNLNYSDRSLPIVLADDPTGLLRVQSLLHAGYPLCLLCACAHVERCHRRTVADLLMEHFSCDVVHL